VTGDRRVARRQPLHGGPVTGSILPAQFLSRRAVPELLLAGVIGGVFAGSLANHFVYDDNVLIVHNPTVQSLASWSKAFVVSYYPGLSYYRPIGLLSYMLDYAVWGPRAVGFHLTNLVLHMAASILVFRLFRRLIPQAGITFAWWGALLFAVHPISSSVVYPITAREAIWCVIFSVGGVLLFLRRTQPAGAASLLCFALALLSKEPAVALPFCLLAIDYGLRAADESPGSRRAVREAIGTHGPYFALLAGYLLVRLFVLPVRDESRGSPAGPGTFLWSWLYLPQTLLLPTVQLIYEPALQTWLSPIKLAIVGAAVLAVTVLLLRAMPAVKRQAFAWLGWSAFSFLATANVVPQETRWDERYLFMPAIGIVGFVLTLAVACEPKRGWRRSARAVVSLAACAVLAVISVGRSRFWHDNEAFLRQWLAHAPDRTNPNYGLAGVLEKKGLKEQAILHYRRALQTEPDHQDSRLNLGIALADLGRLDEAMQQFDEALRYHPQEPKVHFNKGLILEKTGDAAGAAAEYRRAIQLNPRYADARNNLGLLLGRAGDFEGAVAQFRLALEADPKFVKAYNNLAVGLVGQGAYRQAIRALRDGLGIAPEDLSLARNLARLLAKCPDPTLRRGPEAIELAGRVVRRAGRDDAAALEVLAAAHAEAGRFAEALTIIDHALRAAESAGQFGLAEQCRSARSLYAARQRYQGPP